MALSRVHPDWVVNADRFNILVDMVRETIPCNIYYEYDGDGNKIKEEMEADGAEYTLDFQYDSVNKLMTKNIEWIEFIKKENPERLDAKTYASDNSNLLEDKEVEVYIDDEIVDETKYTINYIDGTIFFEEEQDSDAKVEISYAMKIEYKEDYIYDESDNLIEINRTKK